MRELCLHFTDIQT